MRNKRILKEAEKLGMVIEEGGGYRRGGYAEIPGMWLFMVSFVEPPEDNFERCFGCVEAYDVHDALRQMQMIRKDWFPEPTPP